METDLDLNLHQARKLKKLIILNYTERGKRQQFHKYCYIIFILYTVNTYYAFLHINLYISVILKKSFIQYLTYITVTIYISLQKNLIPKSIFLVKHKFLV